MAAVIHCVGVLVVVGLVAAVVVLLDPVAALVVVACIVMVGWVMVVLMTAEVRIVGDSVNRMPIGLFWMIEASKNVSFLSLSLVEWGSLAGSDLVESES